MSMLHALCSVLPVLATDLPDAPFGVKILCLFLALILGTASLGWMADRFR